MNYKNNLLSKKKYKIVNQKGGDIMKWKLVIKLPDNPLAVEKKFEPFEITILQDSGYSRGLLGLGYWYGLERLVQDQNGKKDLKTADFKKNEKDFIELLYKFSEKFTYTPEDVLIQNKLKPLDLTPDMLRFIAATIAFPPCNPSTFQNLHETARNILTAKYNTAKQRCTERKKRFEHLKHYNSHCGDTIGWMINFENNIKSPTNKVC